MVRYGKKIAIQQIVCSCFWFVGLWIGFTSCGGMSDITEDLGEGYFYLGTGPTSNCIYFSNESDYRNPHTIDRIVIYPAMKIYRFNDKHILIVQHPNKKSVQIDLAFHSPYSETEVDSVLQNDAFFKKMFSNEINYWIIDKKDRQTHGPFYEEEYFAAGLQMNIEKEFLRSVLTD